MIELPFSLNRNVIKFKKHFTIDASLDSLWQNICMTKLQKELAFLQDLYVSSDWTERFTKIFDDNFKVSKKDEILYVNAETGNHALELCKKLKDQTKLTAICENQETQRIAQAKADIIKANIEFITDSPTKIFDTVLANATFVHPQNLTEFIETIPEYSSNQVAFFLPTAGSFGEIFSFLWESLFNLDLTDKSVEVERLIADLPTTLKLEEIAQSVGLTKVEFVTKNEIFEFANGAEFVNSPLINKFLLPNWLAFLSGKEQKQVIKNLVKVINQDDQDLSFRFSVKATLVTGQKV